MRYNMKIKVEGYKSLVRDIRTNAIINEDISEYQLYMSRVKDRQERSDEIRNTIKEVNLIKQELLEIKSMLQEVIKK